MMQCPLPASRYVVRISGGAFGNYNLEVRNNPGLFKVRRIAWCDSLLRVPKQAKTRDAPSGGPHHVPKRHNARAIASIFRRPMWMNSRREKESVVPLAGLFIASCRSP
jgi:hypothetical protein